MDEEEGDVVLTGPARGRRGACASAGAGRACEAAAARTGAITPKSIK